MEIQQETELESRWLLVPMLEMRLLVSKQAMSVSSLVWRQEMPELTAMGEVRGHEKMTVLQVLYDPCKVKHLHFVHSIS